MDVPPSPSVPSANCSILISSVFILLRVTIFLHCSHFTNAFSILSSAYNGCDIVFCYSDNRAVPCSNRLYTRTYALFSKSPFEIGVTSDAKEKVVLETIYDEDHAVAGNSIDISVGNQLQHSNTDNSKSINGTSNKEDNRPYEQRVSKPRPARRMNQKFQFLYRHNFTTTANDDVATYLTEIGGYSSKEEAYAMTASFPILLDLSIQRHIYPKLQFLKYTILRNSNTTNITKVLGIIPPQYFGSRLERSIAPRHAFLVHVGLPNSIELLQYEEDGDDNKRRGKRSEQHRTLLFNEFLVACRTSQRFTTLCRRWQAKQRRQNQQPSLSESRIPATSGSNDVTITPDDIDAFDIVFQRGIMAAVRNECFSKSDSWTSQQLVAKYNLTSAKMVELLLLHGANGNARDHRGATLLHWSCGMNHWNAADVLLNSNCHSYNVTVQASRDGATPLHWAAAGVTTREFGTGGHVSVCQRLIDHAKRSSAISCRDYVNAATYDGNTAVMWAAWSGTLDTVKLLVRHRAEVTSLCNRNGCTIAHWAASGGSLDVCKYLATICDVDFYTHNHGGNTPLTHAVAFGHTDIVEWLLSEQQQQTDSKKDDDILAYSLAQDFVEWKGTERQDILQLFDEMITSGNTKDDDDDDSNDDSYYL